MHCENFRAKHISVRDASDTFPCYSNCKTLIIKGCSIITWLIVGKVDQYWKRWDLDKVRKVGSEKRRSVHLSNEYNLNINWRPFTYVPSHTHSFTISWIHLARLVFVSCLRENMQQQKESTESRHALVSSVSKDKVSLLEKTYSRK